MRAGPGLYALWAWLFVALGLTFSLLGPALPALRQEFGVSLSASGLIFVFHSIGYLAGVLAAGPLTDRRGRRLATAAGIAGLAAGMAFAGAAPAWPLFLACMVVAGVGFAFLDIGVNAAIGDANDSPQRRAVAMNLLHAAFPIGTLTAPAALALSLELRLGWRAVFVATAVATAVSLLPLFLRRREWSRTEYPDESPAAGAAPARHHASPLSALREPDLARLALIQGLYVGVEVGFAGWLATYLVGQFGTDEPAAALATSAYWAGFLVGRPVVAVLAHRFGPDRVLPWLPGLALPLAVLAVFAPAALPAALGCVLVGAAVSGVFPTVMAIALQGRVRDAGAVTGLITFAAALGGLVWPWLVGAVADAVGLRPALATAAAPLVLMLFLSTGRAPGATLSLSPRSSRSSECSTSRSQS